MDLQETLRTDCVNDLAMSDPVCVGPNESIADVVARMQAEQAGCVIIHAGGKPIGLFTERDVLKRVLATGLSQSAAIESVMTPDPDTLFRTDSVAEVISKMHTGGYRRMPVVDESGGILGVVSVKRVVQYLVEHFPEAVYNLPPDPAMNATAREGG